MQSELQQAQGNYNLHTECFLSNSLIKTLELNLNSFTFPWLFEWRASKVNTQVMCQCVFTLLCLVPVLIGGQIYSRIQCEVSDKHVLNGVLETFE